MSGRKVYDQPSEVTVEDGIVLIHGPDDIDICVTAEVAEEISERLLIGAMQARGQRFFTGERD